MSITDDSVATCASSLNLLPLLPRAAQSNTNCSSSQLDLPLMFNETLPSGRPRLHFVSFVAYYVPFVAAAIHVAVEEARRRHPEINITYSTYANPSDPSCDIFDGAVPDHLARYYYKLREAPDSDVDYLIVLTTGCRRGSTGMADLAKEWNIPIVVSAGRGSDLRNKTRYPTLVGLMPADFGAYAHVFRYLMDWYKWRTVTIICDPMAIDMKGASYNNDYRQVCDTWARILNNSGNYYQVYTLTADLSQEGSRRKVLLEAQTRCRVVAIITHMDRLRQTMVEAYRMNITSPDYVYLSFCSYNVPDSFEGTPHWWRNDTLDKEARLAFTSLLIVTLANPPPSAELDAYYDTVRNVSLVLFNTSDVFPDNGKIFGVATHTAVHVTTQVFVNNLCACPRGLHDGTAFAMSMANEVFSTIEGRCKLNEQGNRQSVYAVIGATGNSDVLAEVFYYDSADRRFYSSPQRKTWIRNSSAPPDRPFCGYRGDEGPCGTGTFAALIFLGIVLAAFLLVTMPFAAMMVVSRRRRMRQIVRLWFLDAADPLLPCETNHYGFSFLRPSANKFKIFRLEILEIGANLI